MTRGKAYITHLKATLPGVIKILQSNGIDERHLTFGGEGQPPARKPTVPTDARSEFLANRAMGDWAERMLSAALAAAVPDWKVAQYGSTDRIAAGHPEFKTRYLAGLEETRQFGKRPDLLLFPIGIAVDADLSEHSHAETDPLLKQAVAAIEVRSSKFEALTYITVRRRQRDAGAQTGRETPSFTVKVEDLVIVYRWLERNCVPQSYCQVFFDSVFAINFLDIFRTIGSGTGFTIEKPEKSQEKATIMIPIITGVQIGRATSIPTFAAEHQVTKLGRHDAYVVPQGGGFELDAVLTKKVVLAER
ncbi:MAG: AccI family restriction endonuclease [Limisphaerales bacterium]